MYKHWPDLTVVETIATIVAIGAVFFILMRWTYNQGKK
jgi:hypothetical protein